MVERDYLTAKEAAGLLGISVQTLYAYVSRGLVRSEAGEGKTRARRYARVDIEALQQRQLLRRNPKQAVVESLQFGAPVLESAITLIENGSLFYRGHDVMQLAQQESFEAVAGLLWLGQLSDEGIGFGAAPTLAEAALYRSVVGQLTYLPALAAFQAVLPLVGSGDVAAYNWSAEAVAQTGARILRWLASIATGGLVSGPMAQALQEGWHCHSPQAVALLNAALVLSADHELNISAFTARCVASARATPYAVVIAGLSALQGARHGGETARATRFLQGINGVGQVKGVLVRHLQAGERVAGFGHPLYPEGDPRGRLLLQLLDGMVDETVDTSVDTTAVSVAQAVAAEMAASLGQKPNLDFGLAALALALRLPVGAGQVLFAIGRTAGWLAHAIEQYEREDFIRPRATYVGRVA